MKNVEKFCVFCGIKPVNKNKEHVIPQWLIKMTGKPNREINIPPVFTYDSIVSGKFKEQIGRKYSFNSFTLPSCESCNSNFSALENSAKDILEKIFDNKQINSSEITTFLDWIDKVRIGLWLMYYALDRNSQHITPNFFIKQRISQFDRMLHISKSKDNTRKSINFYGVNNYSFLMRPSTFGLSINNYCFISVSSHHLLSRRMGFPFPEDETCVKHNGKNKTLVKLNTNGLQRIIKPIFRKPISIRGNKIYQAVFNNGLINVESEKDWEETYGSKYVNENIFNMPFSKIILNTSEYKFIDPEKTINIEPEFEYEDHEELIKLNLNCVFEIQEYLDKQTLDNLKFDNSMSKGEQENIKKQFKIAIITTKHLKSSNL